MAADGNIALVGEIDLSDGNEFTLGLAFPYTVHRTARFVAKHVSIGDDVDGDGLRQSAHQGPRFGDGLAEFAGIGGL